MRVMVTGGSGFIGSHVVDRLKARGITVRVYDLQRPQFRNDLEYQQGSILDMETLRLAMNGVDAVYHLAAVADVKDVLEDPSYAESINVRGTINVLESVRRAGVKRLIYGSTSWVYSGVQAEVVDETTPIGTPDHFYTATKLAGEYYCHSYSVLYGSEVTILRYGIPYGPRARPGAVVPIFVEKALKREPIVIAGDGSQFRQFVYVEDLAEGNVLALKSIAKNKVYNLDGAEKITIRQIAETVRDIMDCPVEIEYTDPRPGDFGGRVASSERARVELEWTPQVPFEEGIRRYIKWRVENREQEEQRWSDVDSEFLSQL